MELFTLSSQLISSSQSSCSSFLRFKIKGATNPSGSKIGLTIDNIPLQVIGFSSRSIWNLNVSLYDLWSSSTLFNHKFIFLLKANTFSSTRSNQSSFSTCSSSLDMVPYSVCSDISSLNISLNCNISSSTASMFQLE